MNQKKPKFFIFTCFSEHCLGGTSVSIQVVRASKEESWYNLILISHTSVGIPNAHYEIHFFRSPELANNAFKRFLVAKLLYNRDSGQPKPDTADVCKKSDGCLKSIEISDLRKRPWFLALPGDSIEEFVAITKLSVPA